MIGIANIANSSHFSNALDFLKFVKTIIITMHTINITDSSHPLFKAFRTLYESSFPPEEQRSLQQQDMAFSDGHYHLQLYLDQCDSLIGFISYWDFDDYLYIEHFAINERLRGCGYGSTLLKAFMGRSDAPVVLEIDPIRDDTSAARLRFYRKNGFFPNPYPHAQPPFKKGAAPVPLIILSSGRELSPAEFQRFSTDFHSIVFKGIE